MSKAKAITFSMRHPRLAGAPERVLVVDEGGTLVAGRKQGADLLIRIDDRRISRQHFSISLEGGQLFARNLSRNGTVINGQKILEGAVPLGGQDRIGLGELVIDLTVHREQTADTDGILGQTLQGYTFESRLSDGMFGSRYRAVQRAMGREVELQLIDSEVLRERPTMADRFFETARLGGVLSHPHALMVLDAGELPELGAYYMALERYDSQPLLDLIQDQGPLSLEDGLRLVRQIGAALQNAHEHEVVHLNVSPATVVVAGDGTAKLTGLGLARALDAATSASLASEQSWVDSMLYKAPELSMDASSADVRADVYSLAATLYFALTGRPPYEARTPLQLLDQVLDDGVTPPAPSSLVQGLPESLDAALRDGLHSEPEARLPTIDALLEVLSAVDRPADLDMRTLARARRNFLAMLPKTPNIPGVEFAAYFSPMEEVGGDFYDVFPIPGTSRYGIIQGDVSGHGLDAAMIVGMAKTAARIHGQLEDSPARALAKVNELVRPQLVAGSFFTCMIGILDPDMLLFTFARGGHNPLLVHNPARTPPTELLEPLGSALGMLPDRAFNQEEHSVQLQPGDLVLMFTDGVPEARGAGEDYFEVDRLVRLVEQHAARTAREVIGAIVAEVDAFMGDIPLDDDVTLVGLKVATRPPGESPADRTIGIPRDATVRGF